MTTFGDLVYQLGGMPIGSGTLPAMGRSSLSGGAKAIFVHGSLGLSGGSGSYKDPVATLTQAYALCEDGRGDTVYILNDGTTAATVRDAALTWAKDNCHIVGLCAPTMVNQRARISPPTTDAADVDAYTPFLTLSASGCSVINVSWFQGQTEDSKASVGILVSGSRNYFQNVGVITGAAANQGDEACYNIQITGSENTFRECYIGQDTASRGNNAVSANVRFGAGSAEQSTRNVFIDCIFPCFADDTEPCFVLTTTAFDSSRWNLFKRCTFINTGTSTLDAAVKWSDTTGKVFFQDCAFYGVTDVTAADSSYVLLYGPLNSATPVDVGLFKGTDIS